MYPSGYKPQETKEGIYERQLIDCNCNDCKFMVRDLEKFRQSQEGSKQFQNQNFNLEKSRLIERAEYWLKLGEKDKASELKIRANKMKFQFDRNLDKMNYGHCSKFDKSITWIPGICQLETQECFEHRKQPNENLPSPGQPKGQDRPPRIEDPD